jgi:acetyltransferase-like isoleucine patch superfamily enzyme
MTFLGRISLFCYRTAVRFRSKCFSVLISGAFARFGKRTVLMLPLRVKGENRIAIDEEVFIGAGSWLQTHPDEENQAIAISIGRGTSIAGNCVISAVRSVRLEEEVLLARNVYISDHIHKYSEIATAILAQGVDKILPVLIQRGAWLGQNVVICPGVTVGEGAVIGANSVVTKDVPSRCIAAGAPARIVKMIDTDVSYR